MYNDPLYDEKRLWISRLLAQLYLEDAVIISLDESSFKQEVTAQKMWHAPPVKRSPARVQKASERSGHRLTPVMARLDLLRLTSTAKRSSARLRAKRQERDLEGSRRNLMASLDIVQECTERDSLDPVGLLDTSRQRSPREVPQAQSPLRDVCPAPLEDMMAKIRRGRPAETG